jgi:hypothetical protein
MAQEAMSRSGAVRNVCFMNPKYPQPGKGDFTSFYRLRKK